MNKIKSHIMRETKRNASSILSVVAGVGVISTAVLAAKATPKALDLIDQAEYEKGSKLTTLEKINVTGLCYVPAILSGIATISCIFGANYLNKKQQASLVSAYMFLDRKFKDYRHGVQMEYGSYVDYGKDVDVKAYKYTMDTDDIPKPNDDEILVYDMFSRRYFNTTKEKLKEVEYTINKKLHTEDYVCLNDIYKLLGEKPLDIGNAFGWSTQANFEISWETWIEFELELVELDDGLEVHMMSYSTEPYIEYDLWK